jgi:hypothetical protein
LWPSRFKSPVIELLPSMFNLGFSSFKILVIWSNDYVKIDSAACALLDSTSSAVLKLVTLSFKASVSVINTHSDFILS